jgi:hypothetical protein
MDAPRRRFKRLQQIASGKTWVTPTLQQDDYGYFLTARASATATIAHASAATSS